MANDHGNDDQKLTRRGFLKAAGFAAAAASVGGALASCQPEAAAQALIPATEIPIYNQYPEVPYPPAAPPPANILTFFSPAEARTVDAIVSRIIPGDADDPGAHEAGVVNYIDKYLGMTSGFSEPTYRQPPFAETAPDDQATPEAQPSQYVTLSVSKDAIERYGFQSIQTPQEIYRLGLSFTDAYAKQKFGGAFTALTADQQDTILTDMQNGDATGFSAPSAKDFFKRLRTDTINGMFADPAYGGNADLVGWLLIGYPGAQRAYTPNDIHTEFPVRAPQSLAMMHNFHPGEPANEHVVVPVSGEHEQHPH